jgi:hypothetical protein
MDQIWEQLATANEEVEQGQPIMTPLGPVYEQVFQLLVMFWTDLSADAIMDHNAIVHFSGVLGIHQTELCFRKPYDYTPFVSALL